MTSWRKEEIEIAGGTKVLAQMPVIVSASRSTDIPAFYSDCFMERLKAGYVKWFNPFNGVPLYVSFKKMRCIVFWSKNPRPMLAHLDALDAICPNYYFQFTLNDYGVERRAPGAGEGVCDPRFRGARLPRAAAHGRAGAAGLRGLLRR